MHVLLTAQNANEVFHLPMSQQAMQEARDLQLATTECQVDPDRKDVWTYIWGPQYSSSRYYKFCFQNVVADQAFGWIWKSRCTMKLRVFAWLLLSDRLNTKNMNKRRHYVVDTSTNRTDYCILCHTQQEETQEHLCYTCSFSSACWSSVGLTWATYGDRFAWMAEAKTAWSKTMVMEVFITAAWSIWKERNNLIFRGVTPSHMSWLTRFREDFLLLQHRTKPELLGFITEFARDIV